MKCDCFLRDCFFEQWKNEKEEERRRKKKKYHDAAFYWSFTALSAPFGRLGRS